MSFIATATNDGVTGNISFYCRVMKASRGDEVITLTQFENTLLRYLISHRERIVSRDELLKNVWGYEQPPKETRTVDIFMGRLRKIFETDSKNPRYFISVRGAGYKFEE